MGIYIFNWEKLKKYLKEDAKDEESAHDFWKKYNSQDVKRR